MAAASEHKNGIECNSFMIAKLAVVSAKRHTHGGWREIYRHICGS